LCLALEGQHDAAQREARNAIALDPLAPFPYAAAASTFHVGGRYEDAIRFSARALELYPDFALGLWAMTLSCSQAARFAEAIAAAERLVALTDRAPVFVGLLGHACAVAGRRNEALKIGDELAARRAAAEYVTPTAEVLVWAALDDRDQCYRALLRVVEEGDRRGHRHLISCLGALNEESRFARLFDRLQSRSGDYFADGEAMNRARLRAQAARAGRLFADLHELRVRAFVRLADNSADLAAPWSDRAVRLFLQRRFEFLQASA
jgi:tetratricopeptide (TPR) repeat protein